MSEDPQLLGGRYEVGELIGRGGMADVHLGHDTRLGRPVAIKMLRSDLARDQSFIKRFRREAQSSAGLNHASIVAVFDSGEDDLVDARGAKVTVPYMVMEYVEGKTLRELLTEVGKLPTAEASSLTEGVLDALGYSHRMGIVHRDIKPANVMIAADGTVKVMDFGIARAIADTAATMTQTQAVIGTAQYLSPEQAQGQNVDARSDLYSAGCMLYELITGRPPFIGDSPVSIAYQHVGERPVNPSSLEKAIGEDLDAVVLHSLVKNREKRYQSAEEFRSDLQAARLGRPISAAALASLGAASATSVIATSEPTEVYAATTSPRDDAPIPGQGSHTSTLPTVGGAKRRKRGGAAYAGLAVAIVAALALLGFGVDRYMDKVAADKLVAVPQVQNDPLATAKLDLTRAKLRWDETQAKDDRVPAGSVISQNPKAGERVDPAKVRIRLVVSSGPNAIDVPDLAGKTVAEATALLETAKLKIGTSTKANSATVPKDQIIGSDPKLGVSVQPGTLVNVTVSTGLVEMPKVTGLTQDEAYAALSEAGLKWKTENRATSQAQVGRVYRQDPDPKELVPAGTTVTITVAQRVPPTPSSTPTTASPSPTPTTSGSPSPTPTSSASVPPPP